MRKFTLLISMVVAFGFCKSVAAENTEITAGDLEIGSKIIMGTASSDEGELYSETNGTISWIVVDNDDHYGNGGVTLVSEYVLTEGTFGSNGNLYQDSNIRSWLRNDFVNYFSEEESKFLLVTSYESSNDYSNITTIQLEDKFYLLSEAEVNGEL